LGGRSILAHPNSRFSKEKVNNLAKRRDWFMPFAPAVLSECLKDFSSSPEKVSAYMQVATDVTDDARSKIRSGVHVDGTARIQAVHSSTNRLFYEMILKFKELTGIGAVLNTSFNRHGIATISTPRHAVEHLLEGCVDYLAIGNFLVARNKNRMEAIDLAGSLCPENSKESLAEMNMKFKKINESK
jgi:carbamoyltransferase